jgi:hypothetical protein
MYQNRLNQKTMKKVCIRTKILNMINVPIPTFAHLVKRFIKRHVVFSITEKNSFINKNLVGVRRVICEHPFGTIKQTTGYRSFLCKGIVMATAEMSLTALAYHIKRVINILGAAKLREALA